MLRLGPATTACATARCPRPHPSRAASQPGKGTRVEVSYLDHLFGFANGLAGAFLDAGAESIDPSVVADVVAGFVTAHLVPMQPFTAFVALGVVVLALCVAFVYVIRLALTMVLVAAAPVALMFHALPLTDGLARLWWRGITGILSIQVCQSLVLATAFRLMLSETGDTSGDLVGAPYNNDLIDLLTRGVCCGCCCGSRPGWRAPSGGPRNPACSAASCGA